ncbi:three-helix bundle dimerization domain-containing protein [Cryobacterium sp. PAMC25264]|uniref:three-helix bundle dimerization domain-containing protein n=1 Tax=Cryobacterium sp. PAMC25264 TaxID=2861288 RepID=UPI001C6390CC|nr:hypothetical protein [Cryobacterium sp. PAMC25264]QYF72494.1 hypothetical protein KY500_11695 [Cryobacterium sp. PAMC25264]
MSELDETQALGHVLDRLSQRFPGLGRAHIANIVEEEHGRLEQGRVRDFVPVLVEKAAKKRLKKEADDTFVSVEQPEALVPPRDGAPDPDPMEVERARRAAQGSHLFGGLVGNSGENEH